MRFHVTALRVAFSIAAWFTASIAHADVRDFVCSQHERTVPYQKARTFRHATVIPVLANILHSDTTGCQSNAAMVLGAIGTQEAFDALVSFIKSGDGVLTRQEFDGKSAAILALGWIANEASNSSSSDAKTREEALGFLKGAVEPPHDWKEIHWQAPPDMRLVLPLYLTQRAIQALALSGVPDDFFQDSPVCREKNFKASCEAASEVVHFARKGLETLYH